MSASSNEVFQQILERAVRVHRPAADDEQASGRQLGDRLPIHPFAAGNEPAEDVVILFRSPVGGRTFDVDGIRGANWLDTSRNSTRSSCIRRPPWSSTAESTATPSLLTGAGVQVIPIVLDSAGS